MSDRAPRKADRQRGRREIVGQLEDFPRQYEALEHAMAAFGGNALPRPPMTDDGSPATQAFQALRDAGVINGNLCRRLERAQHARGRIEHSYVQTPAGEVHQAAILVHDTATDFLGSYRDWIEPHLK